MRIEQMTQEDRVEALEFLDLSQVRRKLQEDPPEGKGWTAEQSLEAEKWYRRYLFLIVKYPNGTKHVPNRQIDDFWHAHILDTKAYARDCESVFGYFLHHYPYFGLNGDAEQRDHCFEETNDLYQSEFGEDCTSMRGWENILTEEDSKLVRVGAGCGHSGSGTGCGQGCHRG